MHLPQSLQTLLADYLDYAGMYPPARLSLDASLRHYARYRQEPAASLLARFVCAIPHLEQLGAYADLFAAAPPFRFTVIGTGGADAASFLRALTVDLDAIVAFHRRHPEQVRVEAMEVKRPAQLASDEVAGFVANAGLALEDFTEVVPFLVFLEVAPDDDLETWGTALAAYNQAPGMDVRHRLGLKLRTGGVTAEAFPSVPQVARFLRAAQQAEVPFKATAGLHHPIRRYHESVETEMHGFLNVFGAAALAATHDLSQADLEAILAETDPAAFQFTDTTFSWCGHTADLDALATARQHGLQSVGSCSFDEPRDDLRALGLLQ